MRITLIALLIGMPHLAQAPDYKDQLPRVPPRTPQEEQKAFRPLPGFRVELVASEPLVESPVAMEFDENGRLYVAEFPEYNQYANPNYKGQGRIKKLYDDNGDGVFDRAEIFLDQIDAPVALFPFDGGLFVGTVPHLLYCKDTDGDGKADQKTIVLTGFGRDKAGEAMMNSFRWTLDNRILIQTSSGGGMVRRADLKDSRPIAIKGQNILLDPRSWDFELTSGGGQHGMTLDDWGHPFVCSNSDPMSALVYDSRYLVRNPYMQGPPAIVKLLPEGGRTTIFRTSPIEPWRALRTKLRTQKIVPGSDEGGKPDGFFTGATGVTAYRGHAWPAEMKGQLFVGEVASNLVFRAKVETKGLGFVGQRIDAGREFLTCDDNWFRPVQFAHGPDGNLYVVDMYRELIEGAAFLPPEILKHLDVAGGIDKGRIWRIVYNDGPREIRRRLTGSPTSELVGFLEHGNGWLRDTASRLILERREEEAIPLLRNLLKQSRLPLARVHALYSLASQGALERFDFFRAFDDTDPQVREHALRLAERFDQSGPILDRILRLIDDPSPRVRWQLAFTLGAFEAPGHAYVSLFRNEGSDPWMRLAILSSISELRGEFFRALINDRKLKVTPHGHQTLLELAGQIGAASEGDDLGRLAGAINLLPKEEDKLSQDLLRAALRKRPVGKSNEQLLSFPRTARLVQAMLDAAKELAVNDKASAANRIDAIQTLSLAPFVDNETLYQDLLTARQPPAVQIATLEVLARLNADKTPSMILAAWPTMSPQVRTSAVESLFSRPTWIGAFLSALEKKQVPITDLDPARITLLQAHPDKMIRERSSKLFASRALSKRQDVLNAYQKSLELTGDFERGRAIFKKDCSACHKLDNVGNAIGAELAGIKSRGAPGVLLAILDPNREVLPQFMTYLIVTDSGRSVTGMIVAETATGITVRKPDGSTESILRIEIEELRNTGMSFMPEGMEKQIDQQGMADLLAYLMGR